MKKYKLIQWYPSLPSNWKNQTPLILVKSEMGYEPHSSMEGVSYACISPQEMFNTEFWKEVTTKDYEIISFLDIREPPINKTKLWLINDDGNFSTNKDINSVSLQSMLHTGCSVRQGDFIIHSVKRLHDEEIFTVGDKVLNIVGRIMMIDTFYINSRGEMCLKTDLNSTFTIDNIEKAPKYVFKTDDGVDMYKGDNYFEVLKDFSYSLRKAEVPFSKPYAGVKLFSTKENAENYIILNKPVLTMSEIHESIKPFIESQGMTIYNSLKNEIRKKLNLD